LRLPFVSPVLHGTCYGPFTLHQRDHSSDITAASRARPWP